MLSRKAWKYLLLILLFGNVINLFALLYRLANQVTTRALVGYDYFIVCLLIVLRAPPVITWGVFTIILLMDAVSSLSATFLFIKGDTINNLRFSFLYEFTAGQYAFVIFLLIFCYLNLLIIRKLTDMNHFTRWKLAIPVILLPVAIYLFDLANGGSIFTPYQRVALTKFNIGSSGFKDVSAAITNYLRPQKPVPIGKSITFETFENDSTSDQLLVIVESWGLPSRSDKWKAQEAWIKAKATENRWECSTGTREFSGSTTYAEVRELLCRKGTYTFFLRKDRAAGIESIFAIKKRQGYTTRAAHSFTSRMFERNSWWPNIGVTHTYFLEDLVRLRNLTGSSLNNDTPFTSVDDETTFSVLDSMSACDNKRFGYLLTENSHLPFSSETLSSDQLLTMSPELTLQANLQAQRVFQLLDYFLTRIDKARWQKIVIVGDHVPPFLNSEDRSYYSQTEIPFVVLSVRQ